MTYYILLDMDSIEDIWDENTYKKVFKANSKEEAEELALKEIEEKGIEFKNGWKTGYNADYGVTDVEEVA
jgi:hypothetical protein